MGSWDIKEKGVEMTALRHNNIGRLTHRALEEVRASAEIGKSTSFSEGLNAFRAKLDLQVMNRNGYYESPAVRNHLVRKHASVLAYLEGLLGDYIDSYDFHAPLPAVPKGMSNKLWICWWQGLEHAPKIVQTCVESVRRHACGREVVVITEANVSNYVQFPDWIMEKVRKGIMSRTNLSDLLRLSLLAKYGGLWLDATFFCCGDLTGAVYEAPLFSIKRPDYLHGSIASGYFAGYSLGCDDERRRIFASVRDLFLEYWRRKNFLIDYLLVDYAIVLVEENDAWARACFDAIKPNNPMCDELFKVLGDPYDSKQWNLLSRCTDLFKLTWKQSFPLNIEGKPTYYAKIVEEDL